MTDRESVKNYIVRELESTSDLSGDYYEPCGWRGKYYRVNLSVIKAGLVSIDDYVDAFMESANTIEPTLTQEWVDEWQMTQQIVKEIAPKMEYFTADSTMIADLLRNGKYVVHHSKQFNANYHPHYRIIKKEVFNRNILPKLK